VAGRAAPGGPKYTNLRPLQRIEFAPEPEASVNVDRLPSLLPFGSEGHRLVFVNGCFRPDLSDTTDLPEGVQVGSLAETLTHAPDQLAEHLGRIANGAEQPLLALNTAMMQDGLVLRVPRGVSVPAPIEVILIGATPERPRVYHPRSLILLEPDSRATLIEHHVSLGGATTFANAVSEIEIGPGAVLNHYIDRTGRGAQPLYSTGRGDLGLSDRHPALAAGSRRPLRLLRPFGRRPVDA
jgi:Fe-S cluster assembly protein SufD